MVVIVVKILMYTIGWFEWRYAWLNIKALVNIKDMNIRNNTIMLYTKNT